jgi:hypothetical protein
VPQLVVGGHDLERRSELQRLLDREVRVGTVVHSDNLDCLDGVPMRATFDQVVRGHDLLQIVVHIENAILRAIIRLYSSGSVARCSAWSSLVRLRVGGQFSASVVALTNRFARLAPLCPALQFGMFGRVHGKPAYGPRAQGRSMPSAWDRSITQASDRWRGNVTSWLPVTVERYFMSSQTINAFPGSFATAQSCSNGIRPPSRLEHGVC